MSRGDGGEAGERSDEVSQKSLGARKRKCEITAKKKQQHLICFLRIISIVANAPMFFCTRFTADSSALGGGRAEAMTARGAHFHARSKARLTGLQ